MRRLLVLAFALSASGCFPDYSVGTGSEPPIESGMNRIYASGEKFDFEISSVGNPPIDSSVEFTYDFDIDQHEVTVARYREWAEDPAGAYDLPCADEGASCGLDFGGPYDSAMTWSPNWNTAARDTTQYTLDNCVGLAEGDYGSTTYLLGDDEYPMTCATWVQAVAFCASEGKRLPTEAEWLYVASSGGKNKYPWGDEAWTDCDTATINYDATTDYAGECSFPVDVGTASGETEDGVEDMGGSVIEWVWDASWTEASHWPQDAVNYSGPEFGTALGQGHLRNGGAYFDKPEVERLKNDVFEVEYTDQNAFYDQGFRCVRTVK